MEIFVDIMPLVISTLSTLFVILLGYAVAKLKTFLDDKGITEKIEQFSFLADLAVQAAEMIHGEGYGERKKEEAKTFVLDAANDFGLTLTEKELDMFIEAAVKRMNDAWHTVDIEVEELE